MWKLICIRVAVSEGRGNVVPIAYWDDNVLFPLRVKGVDFLQPQLIADIGVRQRGRGCSWLHAGIESRSRSANSL